jgi:cytochrome d ubiquinol oxidase subunit I
VFMFTARAVSGLSVGEVLTSLIALTAVYGVLAVVEVVLIRRYVLAGLPEPEPEAEEEAEGDHLAFAY